MKPKPGHWQNVTVCSNKECNRTRAYDMQHPVDPCPKCGSKVEEKVGRFVRTRPAWSWFTTEGYWEIKKP